MKDHEDSLESSITSASVNLNFCTFPVGVINGRNDSTTLTCFGTMIDIHARSPGSKTHGIPSTYSQRGLIVTGVDSIAERSE